MKGQFESTLLHSFCKGAAFRQWLMQPDCPPILQLCCMLLDKAYGYSADSTGNDRAANSGHKLQDSDHTRVPAPRGFYTMPTTCGAGNQFICFWPEGDVSKEWVLAKITRIVTEQGATMFTVQQSVVPTRGSLDPFKVFWTQGFQAMMVLKSFKNDEESIPQSWIVAHIAHWEIGPDSMVVIKISRVSWIRAHILNIY